MSEPKPYKFEIKRADGTEESVSADEAVIEQAPAWVFKKDGQIVRRILKDELTQEPKPVLPWTPEAAAEWQRTKTHLEAKNPKPLHQRPRQ